MILDLGAAAVRVWDEAVLNKSVIQNYLFHTILVTVYTCEKKVNKIKIKNKDGQKSVHAC